MEELFSNMLSITAVMSFGTYTEYTILSFSIPCMHHDHKLYNWIRVASFHDYATHTKKILYNAENQLLKLHVNKSFHLKSKKFEVIFLHLQKN